MANIISPSPLTDESRDDNTRHSASIEQIFVRPRASTGAGKDARCLARDLGPLRCFTTQVYARGYVERSTFRLRARTDRHRDDEC